MAKESTSSELRHDWLSDRWVIIAPQRGERPDDFSGFRPSFSSDRRQCPFCMGNEVATPSPVAEYAHVHLSGFTGNNWQVRVVPNKFPAVNGIESLGWENAVADPIVGATNVHGTDRLTSTSTAPASDRIDLFAKCLATGVHEVIIESPEHDMHFTQLAPSDAQLVFQAYRDRLRFWSDCRELEYAVLFKNAGYEAGASLIHPHSQLIATSSLPTDMLRVFQRMQLYYRQAGKCIYCQMLNCESDDASRVVWRSRNFIAFCPFASRFPSQVTIVPVQHQSSFELIDDESLGELASGMQKIVGAVQQTFPDAAYSYIIHTAPRIMRFSVEFHWRIDVFPRLVKVAGFEWGSDCYINPLAPELAAKQLREKIE